MNSIRSIGQRMLRSHRPVVAATAATLLLAPLLFAFNAKGDESGGMAAAGRLPVLYDPGSDSIATSIGGWLIVDSRTRRAYELYEVDVSTTPSMVIQSFDLDTLRPLRRVKVQGFVPLRGAPANPAAGGDVIHAVDEEKGRIFLPVSTAMRPVVSTGAVDKQRDFDHIMVIDEKSFDAGASDYATSLTYPNEQQRALLAVQSLRGMRFYRQDGTGRLLMLWADPGVPGVPAPQYFHQLVQWGVDRSSDSWTAETAMANACGRSYLTGTAGTNESDRSMYQLGILRTATEIAIACQASSGVAQVARFKLNAQGVPTGDFLVRPLPRIYGDTIADPASERLYLRSIRGGTTWWVFDLKSDSFVGALGAALSDFGQHNTAGLDERTGRLYTLVPHHIYYSAAYKAVAGGLRYSDGRLTPIPQFTDGLTDIAYPGVFRIAVDPAADGRPTRLFVRRGQLGGACFPPGGVEGRKCEPLVEPFYTVVEDRIPVSTRPDVADPDRLTINVPEKQGVTSVNFDRSAGGFGVRSLLIAGVSAVVGARGYDPGQPITHGSACPANDREIVAAHVRSARVSNLSADGEAAANTMDEGTVLDMQDPVHRCWPAVRVGEITKTVPFPAAPEQQTPGRDVRDLGTSCTGDERKEGSTAVFPSQTATVVADCKQSTGAIDISATTQFDGGVVKVGSATATVRTVDDAERGTVTRSESEARNVVLGQVGRIGRIRSVAESWARGRPETAEATYTREICDVEITGFEQNGCLDKDQQQEFAAALTRAFSGRGEARLRQPDAYYLKGTPGGFQSAVQRDASQLFTDAFVTRDTSKAVPGLELIFYRDDGALGAGREVLQFAGVEASSQYGVYCLAGLDDSGKGCAIPGASVLNPTLDPPGGVEQIAEAVLTPRPDAIEPIKHTAAPKEPILKRVLKKLGQLPVDVARLVFSHPREAGLMAGVWAVVWFPCYLGERRYAAARRMAMRVQGGAS